MSSDPIGMAGSAAGVPAASRQCDADKVKADAARQSREAERARFALGREQAVDETDLDRRRVADGPGNGPAAYIPNPPARSQGGAGKPRSDGSASSDDEPRTDSDADSGRHIDISA